MKLNSNHTFYLIVIFTIVFDLTFTETLVIDTPFLMILSTMKKTLFVFNNVISSYLQTYSGLVTYIHIWNIERTSLYFDLRFIT